MIWIGLMPWNSTLWIGCNKFIKSKIQSGPVSQDGDIGVIASLRAYVAVQQWKQFDNLTIVYKIVCKLTHPNTYFILNCWNNIQLVMYIIGVGHLTFVTFSLFWSNKLFSFLEHSSRVFEHILSIFECFSSILEYFEHFKHFWAFWVFLSILEHFWVIFNHSWAFWAFWLFSSIFEHCQNLRHQVPSYIVKCLIFEYLTVGAHWCIYILVDS